MKPILTIRIYEDIDKPHEIETRKDFDMEGPNYSQTINQLDLYNAIRNAIEIRLQTQQKKLKGETNASSSG